MCFKISDTNRGKKSFTVMAFYIVAVHKQAVQRSFKNRQCHVNNISMHLEHNHEQDGKKDNNYEHDGKGQFYPDTEMTTYHEHVSCLMSGLPVKVI